MSTLLGTGTQFLAQLHPSKVEHGHRRGRYKERSDHGQRCAGLRQALRTSGEPGAGDRRSTARVRSGGRNVTRRPAALPSYGRAVDEVRSALFLGFLLLVHLRQSTSDSFDPPSLRRHAFRVQRHPLPRSPLPSNNSSAVQGQLNASELL